MYEVSILSSVLYFHWFRFMLDSLYHVLNAGVVCHLNYPVLRLIKKLFLLKVLLYIVIWNERDSRL